MTPEQKEAAIKEASSDLSNWVVSGGWDKSAMVGLVQKVMAGHHPPKFPAELFFKTQTSIALKFRPAHEALCEVARLLTSAEEPLPLWLQEYVVFAAETGGARSRRVEAV